MKDRRMMIHKILDLVMDCQKLGVSVSADIKNDMVDIWVYVTNAGEIVKTKNHFYGYYNKPKQLDRVMHDLIKLRECAKKKETSEIVVSEVRC